MLRNVLRVRRAPAIVTDMETTQTLEAPATTWNRWLDRFLEETNKFELDAALVQRLRWLNNGNAKGVKTTLVRMDFCNATGAEFVSFFHSLGV